MKAINKFLWVLGLLAVLLAVSGLFPNAGHVLAQEVHGEVFCYTSSPTLCQLLSGEDHLLIRESLLSENPVTDVKTTAIYWTLGENKYRAIESWNVFLESGADTWKADTIAPHTIYIKLGSPQAVSDAGIVVNGNTLTYYEPASVGEGELGYNLPNNNIKAINVDLNKVPVGAGVDFSLPFHTSYNFTGGSMMVPTWQVHRVEHSGTEKWIRIDIYQFVYTYLVPVNTLPRDTSTGYDSLEYMKFFAGEKMEVLDTFVGARWAKPWSYEETNFRMYFTWEDGYLFQREDASTFNVDTAEVSYTYPCAPNTCYSITSSYLQIGQVLYVSPIKVAWYSNSGYLPLIPNYPATALTKEEKAILAQRIDANELTLVSGSVLGMAPSENDPEAYFAILDANGITQTIELNSGYMPKIGANVSVYVYNNTVSADGIHTYVAPQGNYAWDVMAVKDNDTNLYWFFNDDAEGLGSWDYIYRPMILADAK